jgi:hypothetical protein
MDIVRQAASAAGSGLGALFHTVGRWRAAPKALHPRGRVGTATLRVTGGRRRLGSPLLDVPGEHHVTVRYSRATGLPAPFPDVLGLALRIEQDGAGPADLLFASTGTGTVGRHLLVARREHDDGALTTLLPLRGAHGALLLALVPTAGGCYDLRAAAPGAPWETRGELVVHELGEDDRSLRFDPVTRTPAGLAQYDVVRRLRAPSYRDR